MKDKISPEQMVVGDKSGIDLSESRPSLQALLNEHEAQQSVTLRGLSLRDYEVRARRGRA